MHYDKNTNWGIFHCIACFVFINYEVSNGIQNSSTNTTQNILRIKMLPEPKKKLFYAEKNYSFRKTQTYVSSKNFQRQKLNTNRNVGRNMQLSARTVPVLCYSA